MAEQEQRELSDRLGLDYLVRAGKMAPPGESSGAEAPSTSTPDVRNSLQAFGARVVLQTIDRLQKAEGARPGVRLSRVSEEIGLSAEVLVPLARQLDSLGLLQTFETSVFGDNLVSLTPRGVEMANERNTLQLFQTLGLG